MKEIQQKALLVSGEFLLRNPDFTLHIERKQKRKKKDEPNGYQKNIGAEKRSA